MIYLAHPYVTPAGRRAVDNVLKSRFIGQGPKVEEFEKMFQKQLKTNKAVAVGSGTDALHLSYLLAGIKPGDEVLAPVFNCTAGSHALMYCGAKIVFVDVDPLTLNIDIADLEAKITDKTKAIVTVDYAGQPCDYAEILDLADEYGIPVIEDAAHAVGATYKGIPVGKICPLTTFSFQAIKHITTGDGGMITAHKEYITRAKLLRWFGIDRTQKLKNVGHWNGDITEVGYKYQMTDISAALGIESLKLIDKQLRRRRQMVMRYRKGLQGVERIVLLEQKKDRESSDWLFTILDEDREGLRKYLYKNGIESSPFHYRNDQYTIFKQFKTPCHNMDAVEDKILCLPLHMHLTDKDIDQVISRVHEYYR